MCNIMSIYVCKIGANKMSYNCVKNFLSYEYIIYIAEVINFLIIYLSQIYVY